MATMIAPSLTFGLSGFALIAQAMALPDSLPSPTATVTFGSTGSTSTGMAIGIIVAIVVVLVVCCCGCGALGWFLCARHKRNRDARMKQANSPFITGAPVPLQNQPPPPMEQQETNVIRPAGQYPPQSSHSQLPPQNNGQYVPQGFYEERQQIEQNGYFVPTAEPKMNDQLEAPHMAVGSPISVPGTPAPPYQPMYTHNGPPKPQPTQEIHEMPDNRMSVVEMG